mmetsp:Transcript_75201/g.201580  ORF Transcript_75201/g.201580 Transcript_75201/m.201580 type:complete len:294 (-) Transcript_75201:320-1201(-)
MGGAGRRVCARAVRQGLLELPDCLGRLEQLETLELTRCIRLRQLRRASVAGLGRLEVLAMASCEQLTKLTGGLGLLSSLASLEISDCRALPELPGGMGGLGRLTSLGAAGLAGLEEIPGDAMQGFDALVDLDLSFCDKLKCCSAEACWTCPDSSIVSGKLVITPPTEPCWLPNDGAAAERCLSPRCITGSGLHGLRCPGVSPFESRRLHFAPRLESQPLFGSAVSARNNQPALRTASPQPHPLCIARGDSHDAHGDHVAADAQLVWMCSVPRHPQLVGMSGHGGAGLQLKLDN